MIVAGGLIFKGLVLAFVLSSYEISVFITNFLIWLGVCVLPSIIYVSKLSGITVAFSCLYVGLLLLRESVRKALIFFLWINCVPLLTLLKLLVFF